MKALDLSGGNGALLVMILSMLSGIISLVVDNVVVILMMAPVAIPIVRHLKMPLAPVILMIGFSSNFMGTALLLGDLPPQMLHSVSGIEFMEFVWQDGRPSSFPILMVVFVLTLFVMYLFGFRGTSASGGKGEPLDLTRRLNSPSTLGSPTNCLRPSCSWVSSAPSSPCHCASIWASTLVSSR